MTIEHDPPLPDPRNAELAVLRAENADLRARLAAIPSIIRVPQTPEDKAANVQRIMMFSIPHMTVTFWLEGGGGGGGGSDHGHALSRALAFPTVPDACGRLP